MSITPLRIVFTDTITGEGYFIDVRSCEFDPQAVLDIINVNPVYQDPEDRNNKVGPVVAWVEDRYGNKAMRTAAFIIQLDEGLIHGCVYTHYNPEHMVPGYRNMTP